MLKSLKDEIVSTMNLDYLIALSHLGLFLVSASWFLCFTNFYHVCSVFMRWIIKLVVLGTLVNTSMLLLMKSGMKMANVSQAFDIFLALLYVASAFFVYQ